MLVFGWAHRRSSEALTVCELNAYILVMKGISDMTDKGKFTSHLFVFQYLTGIREKLARCYFHMLISLTYTLVPEQAQQNVRPNLLQNCLILLIIYFLTAFVIC